jgi:NitT/TauT family transport system substrate-binding protein
VRKSYLLATALVFAAASPAHAQKLTFQTSWRAQPEQGGYYMALAKGFYKACGVDLTLRAGGPSVDAKQLFMAGTIDIMMAGYTDEAFVINAAGFPARAVAAFFQKTALVLMAHPGSGVESLEDMRGRTIRIPTMVRATAWPFLRGKYGFDDAQTRPYTGHLGPWLADSQSINVGLVTNEPNLVIRETGKPPKIFMLADTGYASYASIVIVPQKLIDTNPAAVQCFVNATILGWTEFFKDPAPAIELIRKDYADNPDDVVDYAVKTMKSAHLIENEDTAKYGIGTMSDERWKSHFEMLVDEDLIAKDFDYRRTYTLQFVNKRVGL